MRTILMFLLILFCLGSKAQNPNKEYTNIYIGPMLGGTINNVIFAGAEQYLGSRTFKGLEFGMLGAVDFRWQINDYIGIVVQPGIITKGYYNKYKTRESFPTVYYNSGNTKYLNIPLLARARYGNDMLKIYGEFGGTYGYLFDGTTYTTLINQDGTIGDTFEQGIKTEENNPFKVNEHEFGLVYGLGFDFQSEKFVLSMGVNYIQTLTNFIDFSGEEPVSLDARNRSYTFHVSYLFKIPRFQGNIKRIK